MRWDPASTYTYFQAGTGPANEDGSETMHTHLDFESSRARTEEMRTEIRRNRLEARLSEARRANDALALSEEIGQVRRGIAARAMAVLMALFGKGAKAPTS